MKKFTTKKEIIRELRKPGKVYGCLQNSELWIPLDKSGVIELIQNNGEEYAELTVLPNGEKEISINSY